MLVLGIWALMEGIMLLFLAFKGGGWGAGILAVISIVLGLILLGDYGKLGHGLAMLWAGAIWAFIGGFVLIVQAFRSPEGLRASDCSGAYAAVTTAGRSHRADTWAE